jgi:branched-chain amino acid transport system ATP-binding protein
MKTENPPLLSVSKLTVVYHHVSRAIQGISFTILPGQIFALIGSNGAGKTTTLRALSGFLGSDHAMITDGDIYFMERRINRLSPHTIANLGMVIVPEREKAFQTLTVAENLSVSVTRTGDSKEIQQRIYGYFPILNQRRNQLAGLLSGGERQMLAIGQALLCSPKLLLVDELSMGLAPLVVSHLIKTLVQMRKDLELTILLVEQNAAIALDVADYAAVMENGQIVFDGTSQRLLAHEDVREFYLGIRETGEKSYREVKQYKRKRHWLG